MEVDIMRVDILAPTQSSVVSSRNFLTRVERLPVASPPYGRTGKCIVIAHVIIDSLPQYRI